VDGRRVVAYGDQYAVIADRQDGPDLLNYQYKNRFAFDDFVESAELFGSLRPDLIVGGHWPPREVTDAYLDRLLVDGKRLAELHRELLPLEDVDLGSEGTAARIEPYRATATPGRKVELQVTVRNPFDRAATATLRVVVPDGWSVEPAVQEVALEAHAESSVTVRVAVGATPVRRARVAADMTVDGVPLGEQAEALVDVG
jgi:hypothetical protein